MLQQLHHIIRKQTLLLSAIAIFSVAALLFPHAQPQPFKVPVQAPPPPFPMPMNTQAAQDKATIVLELFNPSDQSLTHQLNETVLSQQVEQVMATSYVLSHCKLMNVDEYRDNFRALIVFAQHSGIAPDAASAEALVRKLAESAGMSYSLLYRRTKCDDPRLITTAREMLNWQKIYLHE